MTSQNQIAVESLPGWVRIGRRVEGYYWIALMLFGSVALASNLFVAIRHLSTRYHMNHVTGAWTALTWYATHGQLYPPLVEDGFYGGTRFAPLSILANTIAAEATGEYFVSSKIVSLVTMVAMLIVVYLVIVKRGAPRSVAVFLVGGIVLTSPGFVAVTSPFRGDPAPIVLQLAALVLAAQGKDRTTRRVIAAAALCALAVFFKVTAGFAVIAIGLVLLAQDRRQLAYFCATWFAIVVVGGFLFDVATDGRMTENLFGVTTSNIGGVSMLLRSPGKLSYLMNDTALSAFIGVPIVLLGIVRSLNLRRITIFQLAWLASFAIILILLTDSGVSFNHLLAFIVMTAVCIGEVWVRADPGDAQSLYPQRALMAAVVGWMMLADFDRNVADDLRMSLEPIGEQHDMALMHDLVKPGMKVLSEEPSLMVANGMRPVLVDAWMITKIARTRPEVQQELIDRVTAREFDRIILLVAPNVPYAQHWYSHHFGWIVIDAIRANYRRVQEIQGFQVYERRPVDAPSPTEGSEVLDAP